MTSNLPFPTCTTGCCPLFVSLDNHSLHVGKTFEKSFCEIGTNQKSGLCDIQETAHAAIVTKSSASTLISTVYPPRKVTLHNFGVPHYIRQFSFSENLAKSYVGAPSPVGLASYYGESWIHPCNLTKSSAPIYEMLISFIFPSPVMLRCPEMRRHS